MPGGRDFFDGRDSLLRAKLSYDLAATTKAYGVLDRFRLQRLVVQVTSRSNAEGRSMPELTPITELLGSNLDGH